MAAYFSHVGKCQVLFPRFLQQENFYEVGTRRNKPVNMEEGLKSSIRKAKI